MIPSINQGETTQFNHKFISDPVHKSINEITKIDPLPFIKKGIDTYINERKTKKQKKFLQIQDSQHYFMYVFNHYRKSETEIKRFDQMSSKIVDTLENQQTKKRIIISPNKVLNYQKIMQNFDPYRKQIEKLRMRRNFSLNEGEETPFAMALKQLGLFSQYKTQTKDKIFSSKSPSNGYRSLPKKQFKQKLKPISESNIEIESSQNKFLNVQKINLIESDYKVKQQFWQPSSFSQDQKFLQVYMCDQRRQIQQNFKKIQSLKKQRQYRMNPQLYIKKMYHTKQIQLKKQYNKYQINHNSIIKFYPTLKNKLKNKFISSTANIDLFTQTNQSINENQTFLETYQCQIQDNNSQTVNHQVIKQNQDQEEFENCENPSRIPEQPTSEDQTPLSPNQPINGGNPLAKIQRRKRFFSSLPFQTYFYRHLIWKINFTNEMFVQTPIEYQHRLKAFIGKGNNSSMLLGLIKRRIWFAITDKVEEANFVWTQLKVLPYFKKQHSGKDIPSLNNFQQTQKLEIQKGGGIMNTKDELEFKSYFQMYINFQQKSDERFLNREKYFKYQTIIKPAQIREQKVQNHLINNYVIGNKKALFSTMSNYYTSIGDDVFNYLPLTFHIKNGLEDESWYRFLKYYYKQSRDIKKINLQQTGKNNIKQYNSWIVKPGQNSNRGNGIQVCLTLQEIKNIIKKKQKYSDGSPKTYIVQSYIEKPLLYQKRKFDLRHYMMITCINGKVKGYFYRDGYVRTTSSEYNLKTNCGKIHLTNDAVQKTLPDYGKYQKGNKISYQQLVKYMVKSQKHNNFNFYGIIFPKMKKIAKDVIKACSGGIDPEKLVNNFEVFGMDFMIDSNYNVWLIEVNSNPCLQLSCPLLGSIIPKMIENALQLTMDCVFPPPVRYTPKGVHYYKNLQKQNRFELVFDQRIQGLCSSSMDVLDGKMLYEEDDVFEDDGEQWQQD